MTIKNTIEQLEIQGVNVSYRKRTDGGYIITAINGVKFTGAKGNTQAREMTGNYLSKAQQEQRFKINPTIYKQEYEKKYQRKYIRGNAPKLSKTTKSSISKIQKMYKVSGISGKITTTRVRERSKTLNDQQLKDYFSYHERRAQGLASYPSIIGSLDRLKRVRDIWSDYAGEIQSIIDYIETNKDTLKEKTLQAVLDTLYDIEKVNDDTIIKIVLDELIGILNAN